MSKSWSEVKSVLDDPYVPADTKEALLAAYARETGFRNIPKEAYSYVDGTKASYDIDGGDAFAGRLIGTDQLYKTAKDQSDAAGYGHRMNDQNVEDGRTAIEGMRLPAEGSSSGVKKSNEIFDAARPALRLFEDFLPVNDKVPGDSLGRHGRIKLEDVTKRFDEQMGISFQNFMDDVKRLRDAYIKLNTLNGDTEAELNKVYKDWTGPAANASYQYYSTKLAPNVTDLLEFLQTAPDTIATTVENVFTACKDKANDIIQLYQGFNGTMGSATPEIAGQVVKLASGDFDSQEEVLKVAAWVDASTGSNLESTMREDNCGLNDENKEYTIRECKKWIRQSFNTDLHDNLYANFKQACDDAFEAVNSHYETLNNYLNEYENKFGGPLQVTQPSGGGGDGGGGGGGNGGGGSGSGGGGTGGGGSGSGGGGGMPSVPTPPTTDPGDQTNPSGEKPDDPTQPDPSAQPPSTEDQQETVTIKDGEREISVTSPDGQGMVKVTVDDGSGQPKSYTLDFGGPDAAGAPGTPGQPGQPGQPGTPGAQPGTSGVPAPIEPGPDGKAVITDGDLTITAERPEGQPDTVVVTVDDGTGNPTTYNLDYSESQTSGQPGEVPPQGPGGDGVTTMPAYGEMPPGMAQPMPAYGEMPQGIAQPAGMDGAAPMPAEVPQGIAQPAGLQGVAPIPADAGFGQPMPADAPQGGPGPHGSGSMPAVMPQGAGHMPAGGPHGAVPMPADVQGGPGSHGAGPAVMPQGVGHPMPADMSHGAPSPHGGQPMPAHMQGGPPPAFGEPQHHAYATSASAADPSGGAHAPGGAAGSFGVPDHQPSPYMDRPSGEASLAGAPDSPPDPSGHQDQSQPGMAGGGMPMMGGAPGAGGGSADAERATQWRTTGDLFDEPADPQRFRGAFGGN